MSRDKLVQQQYKIFVDPIKSIQELIEEGRYFWGVHPGTARYAIERFAKGFLEEIPRKTGSVTVVLTGENRYGYPFKYPTKDVVLTDLAFHGYRPGTIHELLALGAQHPRVQSSGWIIQLGSTMQINNKSWVSFLSKGFRGQGRLLNAARVEAEWVFYPRFLAVRDGA